MNVMEAESVFREQIKARWTDWKETDAEKSDWLRRLMNYTTDEARIILDRLSDSSYGKKPSTKDFFDISNRFIAPKPKPKPYEDIFVYLVCLGDCPAGTIVERWRPGTMKRIVFRCTAGTNIQDDYTAEKFLNIVSEYVASSFRVLASYFEIHLDEKSATVRSIALQEQGSF